MTQKNTEPLSQFSNISYPVTLYLMSLLGTGKGAKEVLLIHFAAKNILWDLMHVVATQTFFYVCLVFSDRMFIANINDVSESVSENVFLSN